MDILKKRQIEIAKRTLGMPDVMVEILGGMTKEDAKKILEETKKERRRKKC